MSTAIARINDLRSKVLGGEALSLEEAAEAIRLLREDRAAKTKKASGSKTASAIPSNLGDLFGSKT